MKDQDKLDQQIDQLLASRPIAASDDFAARVLAATEDMPMDKASPPPEAASSLRNKIIAFALPLAAAVALTLAFLQLDTGNEANTASPSVEVVNIQEAEVQEIFLLEESLNSLADMSSSDLGSDSLLATLDSLLLEI